MGLIATLVKLTRGRLGAKGAAPGQSAIAQAEGLAGQVLTPEVYQAPGIFGIPGDGTKGVFLKVGGDRYGVVVAVQNYQITIDVGKGGVAVFATDAAGTTVKAKMVLKADGTITLTSDGATEIDATGKAIIGGNAIELNGSTKNFVTHAELNTALQNFILALNLHIHTGAGPGNPTTPPVTPMSVDISAAATTTIKTGG